MLGDNGLIENAREAKRQTESKSAQELNDIEKLEADVAKQRLKIQKDDNFFRKRVNNFIWKIAWK